jgi:predicted O-methyltransferase YrrM
MTDPEAVDRYLAGALVGSAFAEALEANAAAGLPAIDVSPLQGRLLEVLARASGARTVLELGTLGGYSTLWLARAVAPAGRVVTLEVSPEHAAVATRNLAAAGYGSVASVLVGPALATLATLDGPFDFIFVDADKRSYDAYLTEALRLSRPGTLIVADNIVRRGAILAPDGNPSAEGARRFLDRLSATPGVLATAVQTVGAKGWDGFAVALVTG